MKKALVVVDQILTSLKNRRRNNIIKSYLNSSKKDIIKGDFRSSILDNVPKYVPRYV